MSPRDSGMAFGLQVMLLGRGDRWRVSAQMLPPADDRRAGSETPPGLTLHGALPELFSPLI